LIFENRPQLQSLFLALFWTISFGLLAIGGGNNLDSPSRFLAAFGVSLSFLGGIVLTFTFDYLKKPTTLVKYKFLYAYKKAIAFLVMTLFFVLTIMIIDVSGRTLRNFNENQVLGLETVKKTGIWEIRRGCGGFLNHFLGGSISFLTASAAVFLKRKFK